MDDALKEEKFSHDASDEDIINTFADWLKESETYHSQLLKKQKLSLEYYHGNQTDVDLVPDYLSNTVENRIFEAIETVVPVTTSKAHQFQVLPGSNNTESLKRSQNLQKILTRKYETLKVQEKLEDVTRHMLIMRFGVLKYKWNSETDDIDVEVVDPRLVLMPRLRVDPHKLPYIIEIQGYSRSEIEEFFPDVNVDELATNSRKVDTGEKDEHKKTFQVFEVWTNDTVAWLSGETVLKKEPNPYYDFEGEEVEKIGVNRKGKELKRTDKRFFNHLDNPEKPYIFFAPFKVTDAPLPDTSLVEIGIPIQDSINAQKRGIINNLKQMGNGQVYIDSDAMSEEEAANITNEPGGYIRGAGVASENKVRREPGTPIPNAHFSNLQHSESVFDNLMGVHSATRGVAEAKTLGQDILSRQQDFTRVDTITRTLNRGVDRLVNGLVQLMKLYYTENHLVKIIGEEGAVEFATLNRDDIEDYIEIQVKSGEQLPMDKVSLRQEALQLWQLQAIDPETLFERLEFENPAKAAEKLLAWKLGQLTQETQARIAEAQAGAQFKAQAQGQSAGGSPKGIETPANMIQRARESLGGRTSVSKNK